MEALARAPYSDMDENKTLPQSSAGRQRRPLGELPIVEVTQQHHGTPQKDRSVRKVTSRSSPNAPQSAGSLRSRRQRSNRRNLHIPDPSTNKWDLTSVVPLTSQTVLHTLHSRFVNGCYYTFAGVALVAINPFQLIKSLYSTDGMESYRGLGKECRELLPPHLFSIAEECLSNLHRGLAADQSIIISGESGAGKTFSARSLMEYFVQASSSLADANQSDAVAAMAGKIVQSNPLLEAFGNASTCRNANSSRFGKYIKLQYNRNGQIISAEMQTYLLEKTRVVFQAANEANYHIFYQLVNGASEEERKLWHLPDGHQFRLMPPVNRTQIASIKSDTEAWIGTCQALTSVGVSHDRFQDIGRLLSALLHLGDVDFSQEDVSASESLQHAAELLGLSADVLCHTLTHRQITAGASATARVTGHCESFSKPCERSECSSRRDAIAKLAYSRLFDWLISFVNGSLQSTGSETTAFIGLLDVYGFENFARNSLEQLCINYANEKLHNLFVHRFVKAQQTEYGAEGLDWDTVDYRDNSSCLTAIDGRPGVFALLDEECRLNRSSDAEMIADRLLSGVPMGKMPVMCRPPSKLLSEPSFQISHFAGMVVYSSAELVDKNKDNVAADLLQLLNQSCNPFVSGLAIQSPPQTSMPDSPCRVSSSTPHRQGPKKKTVVSKFKASVDSLVHVLSRTTSHYIRCIKPNSSCSPCQFDKDLVMSQLTASSVIETIKISLAGFPVRMPYHEFLGRYECLLNRRQPKKNHEILKVLTPKGTPLLWPDNKRSCSPNTPAESFFTPATSSLTLRTSLSSRFASDSPEPFRDSVVRALDFNATDGQTNSSADSTHSSKDGVHLHVLNPVQPSPARDRRHRGTKRRLESQEAYPQVDKTVYMGGEKVKTAAVLAGALLGDSDLRVSAWSEVDKENCAILAEKFSKNSDLQQVACMGNTKVFLKESQLLQLEQLRDAVRQHNAGQIQRWWRRIQRRRYRAAAIIQASWRGRKVHRQFIKTRQAAFVIQRYWRSCRISRQNSPVSSRQADGPTAAETMKPQPMQPHSLSHLGTTTDCCSAPSIPVPCTPIPQRLSRLLKSLSHKGLGPSECRRIDKQRRLVTVRFLPLAVRFSCYAEPLLHASALPLHLREPKAGRSSAARSSKRELTVWIEDERLD